MSGATTRIGSSRERHLCRLLEAERARLASVIRGQRRDLRAAGENESGSVRDDVDTEAVAAIDEALAQLAFGEYGRDMG